MGIEATIPVRDPADAEFGMSVRQPSRKSPGPRRRGAAAETSARGVAALDATDPDSPRTALCDYRLPGGNETMNSRETAAGEVQMIDAGAARRIGVVADSHGPIDPRIVAALAACDLVVHAGDAVVDGVMASFRGAVAAVRGNNDTRLRSAARLPEELEIVTAGGSIAIIHGHQFPRAATRHAKLRERYGEAAIVAYGHSHRRCIDRDARPWIVNPGACGRARTFGGPSAVLLTLVRGNWRVEPVVFERLRHPR